MRRLIISDIHLGPVFQRESRLLSLLQQEWDEIIVNGDLFELLGFQTKEEIEKQFRPVISALFKHKVILLNGNHDPAIGLDEYSFNLPNGKKVLMFHGHQFDCPSSKFYVRLNILCYKLFGFELRRLLYPLVDFSVVECRAQCYAKDKCDVLIIGHTHFPRQSGNFYNCGDWIEHYSYIVIEDNDITLYS